MRFSQNVIIYGLGNAVSKFLQIFLVPIFVKMLTPQEYGIYDLIISIQALAFLIGMFQLESFLARYYNDIEIVNRSRLISSSLLILLTFSLGITLLACFYAEYIANRLGGSGLYMVILIAALSIIPTNVCYFFGMLIRLEDKPKLFLRITILQVLLNLILAIVFVVYIRMGISGIFLAILVSNSVVSFILLSIYYSSLELSIDSRILLFARKFSLPAMPSVIVNWCMNYANRFIIAYYLSQVEVGIFSIALKVSTFFVMVDMTIRMSWGPYFWKQFNQPNHRDLYKQKFKQITSVLFVLMLTFAFFSDSILQFFTPADYWSGTAVVELLGLNFCIYSLLGVISMGPEIIKKTKYVSYLAGLSLCVNLGVLFTLVPIWGIVGVAIALLSSNILVFIVSWLLSEKLYYVGYDYKYLLSRFIAVCIPILVFQNQSYGILFRAALFVPCILLYLRYFEYNNIRKMLIQKY
ncbi:MAG: lipopolysaccharide biosynthesis protein [Heyndrickxia sp.]